MINSEYLEISSNNSIQSKEELNLNLQVQANFENVNNIQSSNEVED